MEDFVKGLFANKLVQDDRISVATLVLPGVGLFGVYPPELDFWVQLFALLIFQIFAQCAFAAINYQFIVKQRGSVSAFLMGFGAVIPMALVLPYKAVEYLDIQNKSLRLPLATLPAVVFYRTFEAMYGTSPHTVETSMGTYLVYYSCLMHFDWNRLTGKRRAITGKELTNAVSKLLVFFHVLSVLLSVEMHYHFTPFESKVQLNEYHFNLDLLSTGHLANTYCLAVLTYCFLRTGFDLTAFSDNLKGYATKPTFDNPLFSSRSPSDFWGRKWNLVIHTMLKYGTYLPAKKFFSNWMAILLTFVSSGLLHDYTWTILFYKYDDEGRSTTSFSPIFFKLTAFFLWNGLVLLLEKPVGKYLQFTKSWPAPLVSTLVVLTALPVSHWYTGDWAMGGMFSSFSMGLWHVRQVQ